LASTIAQSKVPPPKPAVFHGRDKEIERLVAHCVVPSTAPLGIVGPGGIGKTTLALKVLHDPRVKQYFGRQRFFLTCEEANSVDDVLSHLAGKLGAQRIQNAPLWPAVLDNLRSRQPVLILLDNFESIWSPTNDELREASEVFLAQLAVLDEITLLVTTRGNVLPESFTWANIDTAELDTLSSTAARMTFTDLSDLEPHVLESKPEANALTELLREVDFMPLAIKLLARLGDLPSSLLREWSEHYTAVLEADHHDGSRRELSVTVSIKISLAHLPAESADFQPRQLLSVMGYLPAGLFPGVSADLCSTIPNLDLAAQDLLRHSLVYIGGCGELRMLHPVRHYVSACLPMSIATRIAVEVIYISLAIARPSFDRSDTDGPAYEVELSNMFHVLGVILDWETDPTFITIILDLAQYCAIRNRNCLPLLQKIAPLVESDGHPDRKKSFFITIASSYRAYGEHHLAAPYLEQLAVLNAELGDKSGEACAMRMLSVISDALGRSEDACQQEARAQALEQESQTSGFQHLVMPGEDLILAEQRLRDDRKACMQGGDDKGVRELSKLILDTADKRGDDAAYIKELEFSIPLYEQMQFSMRTHNIGFMKFSLAHRYIACNRMDRAEGPLIDAYALFSSIDERDGMALVVSLTGYMHSAEGRFRESAEHYEEASRMFTVAGVTRMAAISDERASEMRMRITTSG